MKKTAYILLGLLLTSRPAAAQDIEIKSFEHNIMSLIGSTRPEKDNTGTACAVIRFAVRDTTFVIESNVGIVKRETTPTADEIVIWVPTATKRLTIRHEGLFPLRDYVIPVRLEPKQTYDAVLVAKEEPTPNPSLKGRDPFPDPTTPNSSLAKEGTQRGSQEVQVTQVTPSSRRGTRGGFCIGIGYQPIAMSGRILSLGVEANHHIIELSGVYGLAKSDEMYFYDSGYNFIVARQYTPFRVQLRYGYEIMLSESIGLAPMLGGAMNVFSSKSGQGVNSNYHNYYKKASSFSLTPGARLSVKVGKHVKLHVTPEYSLGVYKSNNCKLISDSDSKFKSWTDGFQLSLGINLLL